LFDIFSKGLQVTWIQVENIVCTASYSIVTTVNTN
jgi:hypothetical protein